MKILFTYKPKKNDHSFISGVPTADITEARWNGFPIQLQRSIVASDLYKATKDFDLAAFNKPAKKEK